MYERGVEGQGREGEGEVRETGRKRAGMEGLLLLFLLLFLHSCFHVRLPKAPKPSL
jgi:hypothetical protein